MNTTGGAGFSSDPVELFHNWLAEAERTEINDPNAMALATISPQGRPEVRIVLLRAADSQGFAFYTNYDSAKGRALAAHPVAELNFHWKSLGRQVRVSGAVEKVTAAESDAYFATRHRDSRIGAWVSRQSATLENYDAFQKAFTDKKDAFGSGDVPRPPHWGGYRLVPDRMEFWIGEDHRLHKRYAYIKSGGRWSGSWLYP